MQTKWFARAGVGLFLVIVATVSIVQMRSPPTTIEPPAGAATASPDGDPLRAELVRCQGIGAAGANDLDCLRAWAENRRRFLSPRVRPVDTLPDVENRPGGATKNSSAAMAATAGGAR
jgi:conjugative transfer region protein TrbK